MHTFRLDSGSELHHSCPQCCPRTSSNDCPVKECLWIGVRFSLCVRKLQCV